MPPNESMPPLAGVMGWPVAHSLSPRLHGLWLARHGLAGSYVALAIRPERLHAAIRALPVMGFSGVNITIPHKEAALRCVDRVEPLAQRIGSVNTVRVDPKGRLEGRNTDAYGFLAHLDAQAPDWKTQPGGCVVLGAGGAARAAVVALLDAGAPHLAIVNRSKSRAEGLCAELNDRRLSAAGWADRSALLREAALLVNTTSLGMAGMTPLKINLSLMPAGGIVYDIVYRPLETALLRSARARGLRTVDGLGMLIHQAVPAFEAFYGVRPEVDGEVERSLRAELESA